MAHPPFRNWKYLLLLAVVVVVLYEVISWVLGFVHIFGTHAGLYVSQTEVAKAYADGSLQADGHQPVIPRIIHQVYHNWADPSNETLPAYWAEIRETCININEGWEHKLWTTSSSRHFIDQEYPWFLSTYDNFQFPIQKIDAVRYFILRRYGGIYLDLDNKCLASMEPLRYYPAWVVDGGKGALSNDNLGGEPNHPYWVLMTDSIIRYAWNYPFPYVTISYATGQWFETAIWEEYHRQNGGTNPPLTRISTDEQGGASPPVFFWRTSTGGTWDHWDNHFFAWIGDNLLTFISIIIGGIVSVVVVSFVAGRGLRRLLRSKS